MHIRILNLLILYNDLPRLVLSKQKKTHFRIGYVISIKKLKYSPIEWNNMFDWNNNNCIYNQKLFSFYNFTISDYLVINSLKL